MRVSATKKGLGTEGQADAGPNEGNVGEVIRKYRQGGKTKKDKAEVSVGMKTKS